MQKQIVFTVKDPGKLESYFAKYKSLDPSIFLILYKDQMEIRGFSKDKDFTKIARLRYSDVFEEAQIDTTDNVYIGMVDKISRLMMSVKQYDGEFNLVFNIKKLTDVGIANMLRKNGYIEDDKVFTTGDIQFVSSKLTLTIKTSLNMVKTNYGLNDNYVKTFSEENSENKVLGRFNVSGSDLNQIKKLAASDSNEDLVFSLDGDNISISSIDFFDISFELEDSNQMHEFKIGKPTLKYMDEEDNEFIILESPDIDTFITIRSVETDTLCFCSSKVSPNVK